MKLVIFGPPGAGKGTHAQVLSKEYETPHISTGDMLRHAVHDGTPLGLKAKAYMDKGELVPDQLVIEMVKERLSRADAKKGFILDGYPRTPEQAENLDRMLKEIDRPLDLALFFETTLPMIIRRLAGRRVCDQCGKTYHTGNVKLMSKVVGICDDCGSPLVQRPDDREDAIENRLKVYSKQTTPLIEYYRKKGTLVELDGDLDVDPLNKVLHELFDKRGIGGSGIKDTR